MPGRLAFPSQAWAWVHRLSRFLRSFSARTGSVAVEGLGQVRATHRLAVDWLGFSSRRAVSRQVVPCLDLRMISGRLCTLDLRPRPWASPQTMAFAPFLTSTAGRLVQRSYAPQPLKTLLTARLCAVAEAFVGLGARILRR
jgi:hypothetical protein